MTQIKYDIKADAVYIKLSDKKYAYGRALDDLRQVDYAADGTPIGVELLCVKNGVNIDELPEQSKIVKLLEEKRIKIFA